MRVQDRKNQLSVVLAVAVALGVYLDPGVASAGALGSGMQDTSATRPVPGVSGDQLLFLYDARSSRVSFLSLANPASEPLYLRVTFYDDSLDEELAAETIWLPSAGNTVIDPTSFAGGGANGNAGLVVVTPVEGVDATRPIVPPEPIVGGFTLANVDLGAGFGQNPFARRAVVEEGGLAAPGSIVDGTEVFYQRFAPGILTIPVYFNPADLESPERDGNRILLAAFGDDYEGGFGIVPRSIPMRSTFFDADGLRIASEENPFSGVLLADLQSLAGPTDLDGSSGKVYLEVPLAEGSVFGLFSQSLSTYAAGQRLPAVSSVPAGSGPLVDVTISFAAQIGEEEFACDRTYENIGTTAATITPLDGRLYLEDIRLVNDQGSEVPVQLEQDGNWQYEDLVLLDFEDGTGLCELGDTGLNTVVRGAVPDGVYERIRFKVGVTESLNHGDPAVAESPLNRSALFWNWNAGYKFVRFDSFVFDDDSRFNVHIGSTGCMGDGRGEATCMNSNRTTVDLPLDLAADVVVVDFGAYIEDSDVTAVTPETPPGCQSVPNDPECVPIFEAAGLPYGENPGGTQKIFRIK